MRSSLEAGIGFLHRSIYCYTLFLELIISQGPYLWWGFWKRKRLLGIYRNPPQIRSKNSKILCKKCPSMVAAVINVKTRILVAPPEGGRVFFGPRPAIACRIGEDGCALQVQPRPLKCFSRKSNLTVFPHPCVVKALCQKSTPRDPPSASPWAGEGGRCSHVSSTETLTLVHPDSNAGGTRRRENMKVSWRAAGDGGGGVGSVEWLATGTVNQNGHEYTVEHK